MASLLDVSGSGVTISGCNFSTTNSPVKKVFQVFFVDEDGAVTAVDVFAYDAASALVKAVIAMGLSEQPNNVVVQSVG